MIALRRTEKFANVRRIPGTEIKGDEMTNSQVLRGRDDTVLRIDPAYFPQKFSYTAKGTDARIAVKLDTRGAVVRRNLPSSNLPFSIALPGRAFKGVAARAVAHVDGAITVTLELHHADPELCIPLLVAHDLDAIVADWQEWALLYDIPMLMVEADGAARAVDFQPHRVSAANDEAGPRRRKATRPNPRLTVRMEDGKLGVALKVAGRAVAA